MYSQVVLVVKNSPGLGRSPGEGHSNPFRGSCLENSRERGACWATVHRVSRVGHDWATYHTFIVPKHIEKQKNSRQCWKPIPLFFILDTCSIFLWVDILPLWIGHFCPCSAVKVQKRKEILSYKKLAVPSAALRREPGAVCLHPAWSWTTSGRPQLELPPPKAEGGGPAQDMGRWAPPRPWCDSVSQKTGRRWSGVPVLSNFLLEE